MNCPSRTDEPPEHEGWNQNPAELAADTTTRQDLNGIVNLRTQQNRGEDDDTPIDLPQMDTTAKGLPGRGILDRDTSGISANQSSRIKDADEPQSFGRRSDAWRSHKPDECPPLPEPESASKPNREGPDEPRSPSSVPPPRRPMKLVERLSKVLVKYSKFIGPGFMISVAYIDPGNYSTDVSAGAATKYKLLFIVLMSNIFAIVLQSLAVRLGTVTGLNLAENCRTHLPRWLNITLYIFGEGAIIATDIAEVIGSAIALNLLLKVPLVWGCVITIVDVLIILIFYSPNGSVRGLRAFEFFVMALVLGVVVCFCIELSLIHETSVGEVFRGYLPSSAVVQGEGIYLSCGILGATVMPHSLYLGSELVRPRLQAFDIAAGNCSGPDVTERSDKGVYRPSLAAIRSCLSYSTAEVGISLFTFALFVNSAILIVAGASLSSESVAESDDLFGIHDLLSKTIAPVAGTIFALALLFSGTSAGIVCTIAGQILSEGALHWKVAPWARRFITRSISIVPSIVVAGAIGHDGLTAALNGTQVALSIALPFISAPLIYFTCRAKYMVVGGLDARDREETEQELEQEVDPVNMRNHRAVSAFAIAIWLVITIMDMALLVLAGLGRS